MCLISQLIGLKQSPLGIYGAQPRGNAEEEQISAESHRQTVSLNAALDGWLHEMNAKKGLNI